MLETTIGELFDRSVRQFSGRTALVDDKGSITYRELGEKVNRLAHALAGMGVNKGDRVALWMKNCIEYAICDFAIAKIGAVKVPFNHMLSEQEVAYRLEDSGSATVICDSGFYGPLLKIIETASVKPVVITTGKESDVNLEDLIAKASGRPLAVELVQDDLAAIMYSGGTTGVSKGVMHTHKSLISIIYSQIVEWEIERGSVTLVVAPLPHAAGFGILSFMLRGGKQVIHQGFHPVTFCEAVQRHKVTFSFLVPTMIYVILDMWDHLKHFDLSSIKTLMYGAAPMASARIGQAIELWGPVLMQGYALMEAANQVITLSKEDHLVSSGQDEKRLSSCGRSVIMAQVKVVDGQGKEVPPGDIGEIVLRSPHMMRGYWQKEEETREAIRDGWLHTGDMAWQDQEGYFYIVDRKKDMIISGGMNVYSSAVEKALFDHPSVRQAAVIGVPDDKWGEAVKAFVIIDKEAPVGGEDLIQHCKGKLSKYEVPKSVEIVEEIPVTAIGKVNKKKLRESYWSSLKRQVN